MTDLNTPQRDAVRYLDGPLLVLAGAGSGKTRVITHKIVHLIEQAGLPAQRIAAVTFTNKAAREMQSRVRELLPAKNSKGLRISTFHTLGLNILRQETGPLGYKPGFSIYDSHDSLALLRELIGAGAREEHRAEALQQRISQWKSAFVSPTQAQASATEEDTLRTARIYADYNRHLKAYNAVDFDDLILLPVMLFREQAEVLLRWHYQIRYLLVDEYQDTNAAQYELVKLLCGHSGKLTVVGDDDQSIYTWRGAQPENLALLAQDFPALKVIKLEQNYRSMGNILKAANQLIAQNPHVFEKSLWSALGYGDPLRVITAQSEDDEAERVVMQLNHHKFMHRRSYGDYAILYRGNHQSRVFERALREHNIPYRLSGGMSFFDYSEVKDILAYLRLLSNPEDDTALLRIINVPKREFGPKTVETLADYARQRGKTLLAVFTELGLREILSPRVCKRLEEFSHWLDSLRAREREVSPGELTRTVIKDIDYQTHLETLYDDPRIATRRMTNVTELITWLDRLSEQISEPCSLTDAIARISLMDILDRKEDENTGDKVQLMTLHAAKGLEFPHVFLVGMEEELLPHRNSIETDNIAEERRLCYVGITRAQQSLTFTLTRQRRRYGELVDCVPSRFLAELPQDDLHWEGKQEANTADRKQTGKNHMSALRKLLQE